MLNQDAHFGLNKEITNERKSGEVLEVVEWELDGRGGGCECGGPQKLVEQIGTEIME